MSENNFEWSDSLVREYGEWYRNTQGNATALSDSGLWGEDLFEHFKKSKAIQRDIPKPDWQVINMADYGEEIYSVKRLSDNEVFSVGDVVGNTLNDLEFKVEKIDIADEPYLIALGHLLPLRNARKVKKVKPKDWEIVYFNWNGWYWEYNSTHRKFYNQIGGSNFEVPTGAEIISIRKISDSEKFSVGDKFLMGEEEHTIQSFQIVDNEVKVWTKDKGYFLLCFIQPVPKKVPLFTSEDGVEIFDYKWVSVSRDFEIYHINFPHQQAIDFKGKRFSTLEKANEYILNNKPIEVSYKELNDFINKRGNDNFSKLISIKNFFKSKINP